MKSVFNNNEIGHAWYHQTEGHEGRNSNRSLFFEGDTIYSYGYHFPIARVDRDNNVTLVNNNTYSNTTSQHVSNVCSSIANTIFYVDNPRAQSKVEHKENYAKMREAIAETYKLASRARTYKDMLLTQASNTIDQANRYSKLYKLGYRTIEPETDLESLRKAQAKETARKAKETKRKQAKLAKENKEKIQAWVAGENIRLPMMNKVYMRVTDKHIETSHGANFPLDHAKLAFKIVQRCVRRGEEWQRNGQSIRLGHYAIDFIRKDGTVKAGCHTVQYDQIERCAKELGLI